MACSYSYARRLYERFKWNPDIRLDLSAFQPLRGVRKPSRVFVGSTMELFGPWIPHEWLMDIFSLCESYKRAGHSFLFLTKYPQSLPTWSPFPDNCWVGVTATNYAMAQRAFHYLFEIEAKVRYISFEPLLEDIASFPPAGLPCEWERIDWFIIGACTGTQEVINHFGCREGRADGLMAWCNKWTFQPKIEWVKEIVEAADKVGIKVFLKDNLDPLLRTVDGFIPTGLCDNYGHTLRQELPEG